MRIFMVSTSNKVICATDPPVLGNETMVFANKTHLSMPPTMFFFVETILFPAKTMLFVIETILFATATMLFVIEKIF
jgi:hypothetical protein